VNPDPRFGEQKIEKYFRCWKKSYNFFDQKLQYIYKYINIKAIEDASKPTKSASSTAKHDFFRIRTHRLY
jgi:hypothetical protein